MANIPRGSGDKDKEQEKRRPPLFPPFFPPIFPPGPNGPYPPDWPGQPPEQPGVAGWQGSPSDLAREIARQSAPRLNIWEVEFGCCGICLDNHLAGPVPEGSPFPSGDIAPPAHDNCRCSLRPIN